MGTGLQLARNVAHTTIRALLRQLPLGAFQWLFPKDVIGLHYHVVSNEDLSHVKHYQYKDAKSFEADVAYVTAQYQLINCHDLARRRRQRGDFPPNSFMFTFDDGFVECFQVVRPILLSHGAGAVFFVCTDFIDNKNLFLESKVALCIDAVEKLSNERATEIIVALGASGVMNSLRGQHAIEAATEKLKVARIATPDTASHRLLTLWLLSFQHTSDQAQLDQMCDELGVDPLAYLRQQRPYLTTHQIRQLVTDGFSVGAHGTNHRDLQLAPPEDIEHDIVASCDMIRQLTGQKAVPYAFPYSGAGIDRRLLASLLGRHDFIELFFDTNGIRQDAPFVVNRIWADLPAGSVDSQTNLPRLLHGAWSQRAAWCHSVDPITVPATEEPRAA